MTHRASARRADHNRAQGVGSFQRAALTLDGASRATLEGTAKDAKIRLPGATTLKVPGLVLQNTEIKLSGACQDTVDTRVKLKYDVNAASSLKYLGNPATLDGSTSGASSIARGL